MSVFTANSIKPATCSAATPRHQRGIALFVGMVFLIVLSLVAVIAMQSTFLEMRMVTNVARQSEAFQVSESVRSVLTAPAQQSLFSQNLTNRGWPVSWGGSVPDADFAAVGLCGTLPPAQWTASNCPLGYQFEQNLTRDSSGNPKRLYGALDLPGANGASIEDANTPSTWVVDDFIKLTDPNNPSGYIAAYLSVVPDGGAANPGAGAAQAAGYRGLGTGLAAGGASRFFQVQSVGKSPWDGSNGRAVTIAQYMAIIQ